MVSNSGFFVWGAADAGVVKPPQHAPRGAWEPLQRPLGTQTHRYHSWFPFVSLISTIFLSMSIIFRQHATDFQNSPISLKLPFSTPKSTIKMQVWWAGEFIFGDNAHDIALDGLGLGYRVHKHTLLVLLRSQNRPFEPMIIFQPPLQGAPKNLL